MAEAENTNQQTEQQQEQKTEPAAVDYGKIQKMLDGTLAAKEKTALQAYFKQQGLSQEEVESAIADFKAHKKDSAPDVDQMQKEISGYKEAALKAQVESQVYQMHGELEISTKTVPYLLRMLDVKEAIGEDGAVDPAKLKEACTKVLNDLPQLKKQKSSSSAPGFKIGADGGKADDKDEKEKALRKAFGLK